MSLHQELRAIDAEDRASRAQAAAVQPHSPTLAHGSQPLPGKEDPAELVAYLESIAGRPFYSREDLDHFLTELRTEAEKVRQSAKIGRQGVWLLALVFAILQYQVIDIFTQVSSLRASSIVPVKAGYRS